MAVSEEIAFDEAEQAEAEAFIAKEQSGDENPDKPKNQSVL